MQEYRLKLNIWLTQYRSKVSHHLSSHFSRDESHFSRDSSRFSRDMPRFSRESLVHLVWIILHVKNWLCVTIAALQFVVKSMGPSNFKMFINRLLDSYRTLNITTSRVTWGKELILRILLTLNDSVTYICFLCNNC